MNIDPIVPPSVVDADERAAEIRRAERATELRRGTRIASERHADQFRKLLGGGGSETDRTPARSRLARTDAVQERPTLDAEVMESVPPQEQEAPAFPVPSLDAENRPAPGKTAARAAKSNEAETQHATRPSLQQAKRLKVERGGETAPRKQSTSGSKMAENPAQAVQAISGALTRLDQRSPDEAAPTNRSVIADLCDRVAALVRLGADGGGNTMLDIDLCSLSGVNLRLRFVLLGGGAVALHARRPANDRQACEDLRELLHTLRGRGVRVTRATVTDDDDLDAGGG